MPNDENNSSSQQPGVREASLCPCKSKKTYGECCMPFHYGRAKPETAAQLMRSRYAAFFFRRVEYLVDTTHPNTRSKSLRKELEESIDRWDEIMDCSRTVVGPRFKYVRNFMPEVPYDAGQKYLNITNVRPILPLLRKMHREGKLTPEQAYFFRPQKETEQLFDLENDPFELHNLAQAPEHQATKEQLKLKLFARAEEIQDKGLIRKDGAWMAAERSSRD